MSPTIAGLRFFFSLAMKTSRSKTTVSMVMDSSSSGHMIGPPL
jgi:hypothetical protein